MVAFFCTTTGLMLVMYIIQCYATHSIHYWWYAGIYAVVQSVLHMRSKTNSMHTRKSTIDAIHRVENGDFLVHKHYPVQCIPRNVWPIVQSPNELSWYIDIGYVHIDHNQLYRFTHTHRERQWPRLFSNIKNNRIKPHPNSEYVN